MNGHNSTNWFYFPISVFIDSQVFIAECYNFGIHGKLGYIKKHIDSGKIHLLTSNIVKREVECHIKDDVSKAIAELHEAMDGRFLAVFRENNKYGHLVQKGDKEIMLNEALGVFNSYLSDCKAKYIDVENINLDKILSDYFDGRPPFGIGKKKAEFPDAFNIAFLQKYSETNNSKIYVISGDSDFAGIDSICHYKDISSFLNTINSQEEYEELYGNVREYLSEENTRRYIKCKLKEKLMDTVFDVDGRDCDRKGSWGGIEYEESELLSATDIDYKMETIDDIDFDEGSASVTLSCKAQLEFDCSFFDEEHSIWDSEEKAYPCPYYGTMHEIHNVSFDTTLTLLMKQIDTGVRFEINEINFLGNEFELDQFTLKENSRERTDNPYNNDY